MHLIVMSLNCNKTLLLKYSQIVWKVTFRKVSQLFFFSFLSILPPTPCCSWSTSSLWFGFWMTPKCDEELIPSLWSFWERVDTFGEDLVWASSPGDYDFEGTWGLRHCYFLFATSWPSWSDLAYFTECSRHDAVLTPDAGWPGQWP